MIQLGLIRAGFAARCEAGLRPAGGIKKEFGLRPRFGLCPQGQRPKWGHSPNYILKPDGREEPCLTSGGEAGANDARTLSLSRSRLAPITAAAFPSGQWFV